MPYRDDLDAIRASVQRLEAERDAVLRDIALVESLPTSRSIETRLFGAPTRISRTLRIEEPFDPRSAESLADTLSSTYGVTGRVERRADERAITWRADASPRGRSVEISVTDDRGGTRVDVVDRVAPGRTTLWAGTALAPTLFNMVRDGNWAAIAGVLAISAALTVALRRATSIPLGRRREREAIAAESAIGAAIRLHATRTDAALADAGSDHDESDGKAASVRSGA